MCDDETCFIYSLNCPDTDKVMYIGKSKNPISRYYSHITSSRVTNPWCINAVNVWIASLLIQGKRPNIFLIEKCYPIGANIVEEKFIKFYCQINKQLLNKQHNYYYNQNKFKPDRSYETNKSIKNYQRIKL